MAGKKERFISTHGNFAILLVEVKNRIQSAQTRAILAVNSELVRIYWDIGRIILERQKREGWGAAVIPRLAQELKNELPELKGFSERNIGRMIAFYREYPDSSAFWRQSLIELPQMAILPQPATKLLEDRLLAEYSFSGIDKPIGISTYELTRALPQKLRSALPTVEQIESELGGVIKPRKNMPKRKSG